MRLIDADAIRLPKGFFEEVNNVPKFYEWLRKQPTISPKTGRWIPIEEKPPAFGKDVLVTYRDGVFADWLTQSEGNAYFYISGVAIQDITAWMPLPEPWKGEER